MVGHIAAGESGASKPVVLLAGTDGDIFVLAGRAGQVLTGVGRQAERTEMYDRVLGCDTDGEAMNVLGEYVEVQ